MTRFGRGGCALERYAGLAQIAMLVWAFALLPVLGREAAAQPAQTIRGSVLDGSTGLPLAGAVVIVRGSALQAVTDANGRFDVVNRNDPDRPNYGVQPRPGIYALEVRARGYRPAVIDKVEVKEGETAEITVQLEPGYTTNFVKVGPSGRYFALEDGTPFVPAGFHHQPVEPDFNAAWAPLGRWWWYNPTRAEKFAQALPQRGISYIRVFLEEAYILENNVRFGMFQDPVGIYNPDLVSHWDQLFDWADQYGFKILVSLYHTDQARRNWRYYPYAQQQGGPAGEKPDARWFTDPGVIEAQKRDLEYIIDRWGQRDSFFAIDLMNEIDLWPASTSVMWDWVTMMAKHARSYMEERWGKAHLLTVSVANPKSTLRHHPDVDFVTTHMYSGSIANPQVRVDGEIKTDVTTPAVEAFLIAAEVLSSLPAQKPYFDTEHGPIGAQLPLDMYCIVDGMRSPMADETYFHNIIWAHFIAGAAGAPTRWGFRPDTPQGYRPTDEMLDDLGRLRRFALLFDLQTFAPTPISLFGVARAGRSNRDDLLIMGSVDNDQAMFWVLQRRKPIPDGLMEPVTDAVIDVPVLTEGEYLVQLYDTRRGEVISEIAVSTNNRRLTIPLPAFLCDIALRVARQRT